MSLTQCKNGSQTVPPSDDLPKTDIRPMFVVGGLYSLANGVAWIMRDLAAALGRAGAPVDVYGANCIDRGAASIGHVFTSPSRYLSRKGLWLGGISWSPGTKAIIREGLKQRDVVHNHSIWMLPNSYASRAAKRLGKPVVLTAHGALEPWAMQHSGWKKKIVGAWFQFEDLRQADCIHVNSVSELNGVRQLGLTQTAAVIPNGVDLGPLDACAGPDLFFKTYPQLQGKKVALFMARLHEKKGLAHLIAAWGRVAREFPDWRLVLAGPDCGFEASAREAVAKLGLQDEVLFTGNLSGEMKASALHAASIFTLPSFSEGFSMSILEALAGRSPVLLTPGCNFGDAADAGVAVEVEPEVESTEAGLRRLMALDDSERTQMGLKARQFIEDGYTWDMAAQKTLDLYAFLLGRGPRPDFIHDA